SYLGMSYLFADLHADNITLERYILHGRGYTDEAKFEFSAEQMEIIYKLAEIANEYQKEKDVIEKNYVKEKQGLQQKLCSKYIVPSLPDFDSSTKNNEIKRLGVK